MIGAGLAGCVDDGYTLLGGRIVPTDMQAMVAGGSAGRDDQGVLVGDLFAGLPESRGIAAPDRLVVVAGAIKPIGGNQVDANAVKQLVDAKLDGALRDVAASFTLMSLHQEREKFIQEVQNRLKTDLVVIGV